MFVPLVILLIAGMTILLGLFFRIVPPTLTHDPSLMTGRRVMRRAA